MQARFKKALRRIGNVQISVAVTVAGTQLEASLIPFRWAAPAFRSGSDLPGMLHHGGVHFQLFAGPLHVWTMTGLSEALGLSLKVDQNPFHGTPLTPKRARPAG